MELFRKGDRTIKKAALSGTTVRPGLRESWVEESGVLKELIESFDEELLSSLLSNEFANDELLVRLYERKGPFESATDEQWYDLLSFTLSNPRISTPYNETWMDGFDEYLYGRVVTAGWKLFETLPVSKKSATLLAYLGEKLVPDKPHDMDVLTVLKRWKVQGDSETLDSFELCRHSLSRLIREFEDSFKSLKDSDDIALRQSYYRRFRAYKPEEVRELFQKDNDKFLEKALNNPNLYVNENIRSGLSQCCWDYKDPHHDLLYPNIFNSRVDQFRREHPDWFEGQEGDIPVDKTEDPIVRANKQLDHLKKKVKALSQKLIESTDEDQQPLVDELRNLLNKSNAYFEQLSKPKQINWTWLIFGLLIGYLLARWL